MDKYSLVKQLGRGETDCHTRARTGLDQLGTAVRSSAASQQARKHRTCASHCIALHCGRVGLLRAMVAGGPNACCGWTVPSRHIWCASGNFGVVSVVRRRSDQRLCVTLQWAAPARGVPLLLQCWVAIIGLAASDRLD